MEGRCEGWRRKKREEKREGEREKRREGVGGEMREDREWRN